MAAANAALERGASDRDAIFACIAAAGKEADIDIEQKIYTSPIEFKADGQEGEFEAVFATTGVIDHDGDVTVPGAFTNGEQVVIEPWNHNWDTLPVGRGIITEDGNRAIVTGKFFTDTQTGLEHYRTVKHLGDLQQWSYSFRVLDAEPGTFDGQPVRMLKRMSVIGVGPVMRGAGIDTRTLAIKSDKAEPEKRGAEGAGQDDADGRPLRSWRLSTAARKLARHIPFGGK